MNFTDAVNEVIAIVKRPDKIGDVRREINAAITFYCLDNDFLRDFTEARIALDPQEYTQTISIADLTRFRKFKYIRRAPKAYLTVLTENEIFNKTSLMNAFFSDRYYIAGDTVNLALFALSANLDIGYYMYPPVLSGSVDANRFWLMDISPYMVIDRAASNIFKAIGDEKSMQTHAGYAREHYMAFMKDQRSAL